MASALADRLSEAYAEYLHRRVRTEMWGYSTQESLDLQDMLRVGRRQRIENKKSWVNRFVIGELRGYPACPWLPQSARPHREADHVVPDGCGEPDWHLTDRVFGYVTGCFCLGTLFRQLQVELFFSWKDQQRSGRCFLRPYCLLVPLVIEFTQLTLWRSSKRQIDCWDLTNPTRHQPWLILSSFQGWFVAKYSGWKDIVANFMH